MILFYLFLLCSLLFSWIMFSSEWIFFRFCDLIYHHSRNYRFVMISFGDLLSFCPDSPGASSFCRDSPGATRFDPLSKIKILFCTRDGFPFMTTALFVMLWLSHAQQCWHTSSIICGSLWKVWFTSDEHWWDSPSAILWDDTERFGLQERGFSCCCGQSYPIHHGPFGSILW